MIQRSTVKRKIGDLVALYSLVRALEANSEAKYGYIIQSVERRCTRLMSKYNRKRDNLIERLHTEGWCGLDGVSVEDTCNDFFNHNDFADVPLYEVGNGWCD